MAKKARASANEVFKLERIAREMQEMNARLKEHPNRWAWVSRDGSKTRICDMDDQHLINTVLLVERTYSNRDPSVMFGKNYIPIAQRGLEMEIEKRGLEVALAKRSGDVRRLVKAVAEQERRRGENSLGADG